MEKYRKKLIVSLVLLLFVITGCSVIGFGLHSMFTIYDEIDTETTDLFKSIETTCDTLAENSYLSMDSFTERILKNAEVSAYFAGFLEAGEEEGDDITGPFQKGDIIRLENGNVITNGNLPFHTEGFADSLNKNKWLVEPSDFQDANINEDYIKRISAKIMTEIDDIEEKLSKEKDTHKLEVLSKKVKKLFERLHRQRKESLEKHGEFGTYNIIWKVLRRTDYLDKIWDIINTIYNKVNSIN